MIYVQLNKEFFENDIHSLVKAFYPSENVSVCTAKKECSEAVSLRIDVEYRVNEVAMRLMSEAEVQALLEQEHGADSALSETRSGSSTKNRYQEIAFTVDYSDRKETRNLLKQNLYDLLSEHAGRTLPWGTLTGVRPTKIPMTMLEEGHTTDEIRDHMKKAYGVSDKKIDLSIEIAKRERELLSRLDYVKGYSLYIGIPFCPSTCLYCSFTSYPVSMWEQRIDEYLDALEKELMYTARLLEERHLNTIYIGGGTPTTLKPYQLERLITAIERNFDFSDLLEFTVEAGRPDSIDKEKLEVLRAHNISRISINPQTMKQETLDLIGRRHTVQQTIDSFYLARSLGFDNINMDLIMGLPQETLEDVRSTMKILGQLQPDSITVHSLALKRAARLQMFKEDYAGLKMINTQAHLDAAADVCLRMGLLPYYLYRQKNMAGNFENVGYAREGKAGIYNVLIMEEKQTIVACGAGSISKRVYSGGRIERCENVKDVASFIERIDEMIERKRKLLED